METTLPPKKQFVARGEATMNGHANKTEVVNIFKVDIIEGKRKRILNNADQVISDWLTENFEERPGRCVYAGKAHRKYLETCVSTGANAFELPKFIRVLKSKFPNGHAIREGSIYHGVLKDRTRTAKPPKEAQAASFKLRMADILAEILDELGNPTGGVRFGQLVKLISNRYPALRLDLHPGKLLRTILTQARFGKISVVRGIGKCGYYRLPKEAATKETKKESDGDVKEEDDKEDGDAAGKNKEESVAKSDNDTQSSPVKQEQKPKKKKPQQAWKRFVVHGVPNRVEDTFSMAMTFQSEPKSAAAPRIKRYITDYYRVENLDTKLKRVLEIGIEKGFWRLVSGHGLAGKYELAIEEFDPTNDNDLTGMVVNAIMGCHEPKQCSAMLLKRYVVDFHPEFKVAERPFLFKKALERAVTQNLIRQLSGLGANGTFQMVDRFTPSPAMLHGTDTDDDYVKTKKGKEEESIIDEEPDLSAFQDRYVPRPTKSGRSQPVQLFSQTQTAAQKPAAASRRTMKRKEVSNSGKNVKKSAKKAKKRPSYQEVDSDDESGPEEVHTHAEKYVPRPSASRGGAKPMSSPKPAAAKKSKSSKKARSVKKPAKTTKKRPSYQEVDSDDVSGPEEDHTHAEKYVPRPGESRGGAESMSSPKKPPSKPAAAKKSKSSKKARSGARR